MNTPPLQPEKRRKGCLFYGCLTLVILCLAVLVGGGLGLYLLYQKAEAVAEKYAATEPMELPQVHYTQVDQDLFQERLKTFADGLAQGKPTVPLTLQGEDLNLLLASSPDLKVLSEGVRLKVEGDEVKGLVSLRLGDLGFPFFKDRYINGEISFQVSLADSRLTVSPREIRVNDKPLPGEYLAAIRQHNFAESANQNPDLKQTLDQIESIEVKDGVVKVAPKSVP